MSDLVKRLRAIHIVTGVRANRDILGTRPIACANQTVQEAADALEALQAERDRLREAGRYLLRAFDHINDNPRRDPVDDVFLMVRDTSTISSVSDARAALGDDT